MVRVQMLGRQLFRKQKLVISVLLLICLSIGVITPPANAESSRGDQVMPISIDGYYVLFPGESAPFVKAGKLMVPIRSFVDVIGANLMYKPQTKMSTVSLLGRSVGNIKAGKPDAVFDGDMGFSLGAEPELRYGMLFVPAIPVLRELQYRWEIQSNNLNRPTIGIHFRENMNVLLARIVPPVDKALFPTETTVHPYPLYPNRLTQEVSGKEYKLKLSVQNTSDSVISKGSAELELIFVDSQGKSILRKLIGPDSSTPKAAELSLDFLIPAKVEYVLFRARTVK
ncbi:stalk domain-containing protein [Paenibacillus wynnii]|uniref:stalk domain-containing protein n=1 Tax=Paenibacillus wynnii TaxID=268407 RepID=UPI00278D919B|nr:stalk domain-containing protein [Paenibacillus wynnii]MDQ0196438.1 hypothetical protein [Paenibacillus wynnii]